MDETAARTNPEGPGSRKEVKTAADIAWRVALVFVLVTTGFAMLRLHSAIGTLEGRITAAMWSVQNDADSLPEVLANFNRVLVSTDSAAKALPPLLSETRRTVAAARPVLIESQLAVARASRQVDRITEEARTTVVELRGTIGAIRPVVDNANETLAQTNSTIALIRPQAVGLLAGWKVTGGEFAQMARRFDSALPEALATWQRIGNNSDQTTAATAVMMKNFALSTRPLPKWMRIGLAIAPPVAQTGAAAVAAGVALGAFR